MILITKETHYKNSCSSSSKTNMCMTNHSLGKNAIPSITSISVSQNSAEKFTTFSEEIFNSNWYYVIIILLLIIFLFLLIVQR